MGFFEIMFIVGALLIGIALWVFLVVVLLHDALDVLPFEFQSMSPSSVFLLFIPLFNVVWLYFVVIRISDGYRRYFESKNIETHGACGFGVGLAWAICTSACITPFIQALAALGALVCMIIYVVTVLGCKHAALALINEDDLAALGPEPGALPAADNRGEFK